MINILLGQNDKTEVAFRRAISILEKADEDSPPSPDSRRALADTYCWLGQMLKVAGRVKEAERFVRQDVLVSEKLVTNFATVPSDRLHLSTAYVALARLLTQTGRGEEAEQTFQQAVAIARRITADFPDLNDTMSYDTHHLLGDLLRDLGRFPEAEQTYRRSMHLARRLLADSPTAEDHWHRLSLSQTSLVRLYIHTDQLGKAEEVCRQSIALGEQLTARFPDVADYQGGPAWSYVALGDLLWVKGQCAAAAEEYQRALAVKPNYADGHCKLAWFLVNCSEVKYRDPAQAVEEAKKALALTMENGHYWKTLGWVSYRAGRWEDAIKALERANWYCAGGGSYEWFALAMAHWQRGDQQLARQWYAKACKWMEDHQDPFAKEPGFFWDDEFCRFRDEAAKLLQIAEQKKQPQDAKDTKKPQIDGRSSLCPSCLCRE